MMSEPSANAAPWHEFSTKENILQNHQEGLQRGAVPKACIFFEVGGVRRLD